MYIRVAHMLVGYDAGVRTVPALAGRFEKNTVRLPLQEIRLGLGGRGTTLRRTQAPIVSRGRTGEVASQRPAGGVPCRFSVPESGSKGRRDARGLSQDPRDDCREARQVFFGRWGRPEEMLGEGIWGGSSLWRLVLG